MFFLMRIRRCDPDCAGGPGQLNDYPRVICLAAYPWVRPVQHHYEWSHPPMYISYSLLIHSRKPKTTLLYLALSSLIAISKPWHICSTFSLRLYPTRKEWSHYELVFRFTNIPELVQGHQITVKSVAGNICKIEQKKPIANNSSATQRRKSL